METRKLTDRLMAALTSGDLHPIEQAIRQDDTLMPGLRGNRLDIYYRGGVLLQIEDTGKNFATSYNLNYGKHNAAGPTKIGPVIASPNHAATLVDQIYDLKRQIDQHLFNAARAEREVQQMIAHENNLSPIAAETDYFIADIELIDKTLGAKFDMVAVRWANSKKGGNPIMVPVLIEVKHGIGALQGESGLSKHLQDMEKIVERKPEWLAYLADLQEQLAQLDTLGAMKWNRSDAHPKMPIDMEAKPEILFILANYNPASTQLNTFLSTIAAAEPGKETFDLRFATSCFAGYGLYKSNMLSLPDFQQTVRASTKPPAPTP